LDNLLQKIELGVVANKAGKDNYIFIVYRRASIIEVDPGSKGAKMVTLGRWYKVRTDKVYIDRIREYIDKCRKGGVVDINDNIL